ncbi:MAG: hypothetical protein M3Q33_06785, partial [Acidobacteriota bacterium]|nr:hypothetical protein [Acidobacteriota bacterium]
GYTLSRLRNYLSNWSIYFESEEHLSRTRMLLDKLQEFEPYVNFGKPILTWTGLNPNKPDDKIADKDLSSKDFDFDIKELMKWN